MKIIHAIERMAVAFLAMYSTAGLAAGEFDPSFNILGFTRDFLPLFSGANGLAIHSTGEIVTSGFYFGPDQFQLVLWRHLPDGTLDPTFGGTGIVLPPTAPDVQVFAAALAIDCLGRIVLVSGNSNQHVVYRFNFDGTPDLSFSGTGSMSVPLGFNVFPIVGLAIQSDDKIIGAAGASATASQFAVYRVLAEGGLDPSFGGTGLVFTQITPGGGTDRATGVGVQPDGKIVVSGRARALDPGAFFDYALARYSTTGDLDNSFGNAGKVIVSVRDNDYGRRVVIQPDGKIVIAGSTCVGALDDHCFFGAARVDQSGALDPSFGDGGKVVTDVGIGGGLVFDVALQPDNYIVVSGEHNWIADRTAENNILVRYAPNGALDPLFGVSGISETNYGYVVSESATMRLQSDGQIVLAGSTFNASTGTAVTARYIGGAGTVARAANEMAHQTPQHP
jgi:uncharacterized delta-60 repeat protein